MTQYDKGKFCNLYYFYSDLLIYVIKAYYRVFIITTLWRFKYTYLYHTLT